MSYMYSIKIKLFKINYAKHINTNLNKHPDITWHAKLLQDYSRIQQQIQSCCSGNVLKYVRN